MKRLSDCLSLLRLALFTLPWCVLDLLVATFAALAARVVNKVTIFSGPQQHTARLVCALERHLEIGPCETLALGHEDLGTGAHAACFRIYRAAPSSGPSLIPGKGYVLKVWRPSTLRDTLAWSRAAMELRTSRALHRARQLLRATWPTTNLGTWFCRIAARSCDYKASLSRRAQYLASFEVEAGLYQAPQGLGCGCCDTLRPCLGRFANAPVLEFVKTTILGGCISSYLVDSDGEIGSVMLLEDVCTTEHAPPAATGCTSNQHARDARSSDSTIAPGPPLFGSWHCSTGFDASASVACVMQLAKLHAEFWDIGNSPTSGGRECADLSQENDRHRALAAVRRSLGAVRGEDVDVWAEGGYWLGEKRPLVPTTPSVLKGLAAVWQRPLCSHPHQGAASSAGVAVAAAWERVELSLWSRFGPEFRAWAREVRPGVVLAEAVNFQYALPSNGPKHAEDESSFVAVTGLEEAVAQLRPLTLIHGDFKVNNIFLHHDSPSTPMAARSGTCQNKSVPSRAHCVDSTCAAKEDRRVRVIDWQWCGLGVGAADLAHLCMTSCEHAGVLAAPGGLDLLLSTYHSTLEAQVKARVASAHPSSRGTAPCTSLAELRRQVALHVVRFGVDQVLNKWGGGMSPRDFDVNRAQGRHGLDRRSIPHAEACVVLAVSSALWLMAPPDRLQAQETAASEASSAAGFGRAWPWPNGCVPLPLL